MEEKDFSELLKNFSQMINDGTIPDEMKNIINNFSSNNNSNTENSSSSFQNIDINTIIKIKSMLEKMNDTNDPRANLLRSLKPYLKSNRKSKVDQYIQLLNMSKVIDLIKPNGGESIK